MTPNLPAGTVTFLFTDIEDSAKIAQEYPKDWEALRARHHAILRGAIEVHKGRLFQIIGDASCSAFHTVRDALHAAVAAQQQLEAEAWSPAPIRVRMGIHTGEAQPQDGEYTGYLTLTRVQRVMSAAHGGQVLLSDPSAVLLRTESIGEITLIDLGEHRLKSLPNAEHIWQAAAPGMPQDFPPLESLNTIPNNLPIQLTSFLGRETEIAEICKLLETHRLATLTGAGGTGKTRLSLQVAAEVLDRFRDGVWFIELAPLADPALVPSAVASVLHVREAHSRPLMEDLLNWLESKELLLVIDNCEHLVESCARFADAVVHASRTTNILATSREALGIAGEIAYHVPSLECPRLANVTQMGVDELGQYPAVRLFTERARESVGTFGVTSANALAVAQICTRLDGIPLAIELAAARMKVLRAEQIAERLNDRFRLLTGGSRTALPRHQTLRSLIDWSYGLLTDSEQILLRRLSAFAGSWTLDAAEQVCAGDGVETDEILDLLAHLVDKSLIGVDETAAEPRYRILETIREYAREKLSEAGEAGKVRGRHLDFMMAFTQKVEAHSHSSEEKIWQDRLESEIDNLRTALEWSLSLDQAEAVLQLAGSVYWFWWTRGHWHEARTWLREALGKSGAEERTRARAKALNAMGWFGYMAGEFDAAHGIAAEAVAISRALGDKQMLAESLSTMGLVGSLGDPVSAGPMLSEGLQLSRELGYKQGIANSLLGLGNCRTSEGSDERAQAYFEDAVLLFQEVGDKSQLAFAVRRLGLIDLRRSAYGEAFSRCTESLNLNMETGDQRGVAASVAAMGSIATRQGHLRRAAKLYGAAAAMLEPVGGQFIPLDTAENEPHMLTARGQIGEEEYAKAYSEGRGMTADEAIAYALQERPA